LKACSLFEDGSTIMPATIGGTPEPFVSGGNIQRMRQPERFYPNDSFPNGSPGSNNRPTTSTDKHKDKGGAVHAAHQ
jgi:hypothetical protein